MSKLSASLKSLINAPFARPGPLGAPSNIKSVLEEIAKDASSKKVGVPAWLSIATATTFTLNSPSTLSALYAVSASAHPSGPVASAQLMREVGLKTIGFNGVPRSINMLGALRHSSGIPEDVLSQLPTEPTREPTSSNVTDMSSRGFALWKSIYHPFDEKLYEKLAQSHPDLPVHILHSEYGALFADPPLPSSRVESDQSKGTVAIGRVLTSLVAIACLRTQTGVGPQVLSHVFGLRKAFEDGSAESEDLVQGGKWLSTDEGSTWVLETTDRIVAAVGGSSFAAGQERAPRESKL